MLLHAPKFALLDECTSAVPEDFEAAVFRRLLDDGVTLVTVSHRSSVSQFHAAVVTVADGTATMSSPAPAPKLV